MKPEDFDRFTYAAQEFDWIGAVEAIENEYLEFGWAAPISGDATAIYRSRP